MTNRRDFLRGALAAAGVCAVSPTALMAGASRARESGAVAYVLEMRKGSGPWEIVGLGENAVLYRYRHGPDRIPTEGVIYHDPS